MKLFTRLFTLVLAAQFMLIAAPATAEKRLVFAGGPAGGTFQVVANAIQTYGPVKDIEGVKIQAQSSAGSVENLRNVNKGKAHFGTVYSGHVYLGSEGRLKNDKKKYEDVRAVSFLYGAPAQLVVRKDSGITSIKDLVGKKVGVGNAGSGAYANAELFFSHIKLEEEDGGKGKGKGYGKGKDKGKGDNEGVSIWDSIERNAMGYNDAASAFNNKQLDAFWVFAGYPVGAVILASETNDIDLVDLDKDAEKYGFYHQYPYFDRLSVPENTYKGVDKVTPSFQDSALWVAHKDVSDDVIYQMLTAIFSEEGLAHMVQQKKTFKAMAVSKGIDGIVTPLHPGAEKFWREKGLIETSY